TVRRAYVDALIDAYAAECAVRLKGSVALVEEAEAKLGGGAVDPGRVRAEIDGLLDGHVDVVVLACTHFPLLLEELKAVAERSVRWINSGDAIARRVESLLKDVAPRGRPPARQTAFLTGPDANEARRRAFADHGFDAVVSLMH
ncbi:MAG: glutamate racemase, partial [Litorimonas sp.]